jgi:hypothetical protein
MRILGVSQALTVLILVIFVLVPFGAAEALKAGDPGWCSGPDRYGIATIVRALLIALIRSA